MNDFTVSLVRSLIAVALLMTAMPYITWFERRLLSRMQSRVGPNRVGLFGLLQPLADGLKLFFKEDIRPDGADRLLFVTAPAMALFAAIATFAVVPIGPSVEIAGTEVSMVVADLPVGALYVVGASSLGIYALLFGGWSSGSKYSLLGALRAAAQVVSYELLLGMAIVCVVLVHGSTSIGDIVAGQQRTTWTLWLQPVAFVLYLIAACAETNRAPFDLPEAETELVAGYLTEYTGMRFAMFFIAEYINMFTVSALAATLFLGGWSGPFWPGPHWLLLKILLFLFLFVWVRATLPRLRYDQLMRLSWSTLIPLAMLNVAVTAVVIVALG
ncbi:MAG TPA: NADH-quinone oxidoreductase subunit NuoH [Planctomycetota bacterium]|nr:NADH-quinone oxidoreductase subunit NuoH [Planctomycetota bacterium]